MGTPQTTIYDSVLIASIVLGIIIVYFFISVIRQQRENLSLRKKNILTEIAGLEKERARIATDLHDELGPLLSAVKMKINSFELSDPEDEVELEKTNVHIDDVIKRMREISFDLMPNILLKNGLSAAINSYVNFLRQTNTIQFSVSDETNSSIHEDKAVNIYRIVREVTHNSIKHSGAGAIQIELKNNNNKIILNIRDNGKGFDYKKALADSTGIGLQSISNRTQIVGGKMFLVPSETGTHYYFEIPL